MRVLDCEHLLMEVGIVEDSKQGTYKRVNSVLVGAMTWGSWLVLDNANTCSASLIHQA